MVRVGGLLKEVSFINSRLTGPSKEVSGNFNTRFRQMVNGRAWREMTIMCLTALPGPMSAHSVSLIDAQRVRWYLSPMTKKRNDGSVFPGAVERPVCWRS